MVTITLALDGITLQVKEALAACVEIGHPYNETPSGWHREHEYL